MADSALNLVDPAVRPRSTTAGDVPDRVGRRYLTDARNGPGLGFYVDAQAEAAMFRDQGKQLSTQRNDPQVVRDLVAISQHRGWTTISVRGQTDFRREVWLTARLAGLEVRGYRPTERDLQLLARRAPERETPPAGAKPSPGLTAQARLRVVEAVVGDRIVERAARDRILAAARARLARWLERPPERMR